MIRTYPWKVSLDCRYFWNETADPAKSILILWAGHAPPACALIRLSNCRYISRVTGWEGTTHKEHWTVRVSPQVLDLRDGSDSVGPI